jgi:hypothetical protein
LREPDVRRLILPLLATLAAFVPLAVMLAGAVPTAWQSAIHLDVPDREGVPIEIGFPAEAGDIQADVRTGGLPITVANSAWLRGVETVSLLVATYNTSPTLVTARLGAADGTCEFRAEGGEVPNNGLLTLSAVHCNPSVATHDFMLWVRVSGEGRVAVWTYLATTTVQGDQLDRFLIPTPDGSAAFAVRGEAEDVGLAGVVRRVDLVAHFWQRDAATIWFWVLLFALCGFGGAFVLTRPTLTMWRVPMGAAAVALSIAGTWAVMMPPLQGADEPDHLLSYAEVVGAPQVDVELPWLARRTHFERLRFRGDQRFRAADIDRPHDPAWTGDIHSERMDQRSAVAVKVWRVMAAAGARSLPLPDLLLAVRALDALVFAGVVGLAAWIVWWAASGRIGLWSMVGLAIIPTLPYFATMVSDWAFVASWSVLFAAGLIVLHHDGPRASWAGLTLGLAVALLFGTSISAFALIPLVGIVFATRVIMGDRADARGALVFWSGVAVGALAAIVLTRRLFEVGFARYDAAAGSSATLLGQVNVVAAHVAESPWVLFLPIAALALLELGVRRALASMAWDPLFRLFRLGALAVAGCAAAVWVSSLVIPWPHVALLESGTYAHVIDYVVDVMASVATVTRLRGLDHLTFTSFMSGFGWIDAILPTMVLALITAACVAALWASSRGTDRQVAWFVTMLVAVAATVTAAAAAGFLMRRNLHGRYILTAGVAGMAIIGAGAGRWLASGPAAWRATAVVMLALLHGISLAFVLTRYL